MTEVILALNAGSSSIKFSLFGTTPRRDTLSFLYRGGVEGLGGEPHFLVDNAMGQKQRDEQLATTAAISHEDALSVLLEWIERHEAGLELIAVGHRIVHGGTLFSAPVLVDQAVFTYLEQLVPLAPLHQPHNLAAIQAVRQHQTWPSTSRLF